MTVPLMIWSASIADRQPGVEQRDQDREDHGGDERDDERRRDAQRSGRHRTQDAPARRCRGQPTNAATSISALDADVDDAGALAHDAAQGAEGDRRGGPQDDRRRAVGRTVDEIPERARTPRRGWGCRTGTGPSGGHRFLRVGGRDRPAPRPGAVRAPGASCAPAWAARRAMKQDHPLEDVDDLDAGSGPRSASGPPRRA